jgi:D-galactarolactone cycloisomerase
MAPITRLDAHAFVAPVPPVVTSFGQMSERPALILRIEDCDGAHGWGEIWCNFPAGGWAHRLRLLRDTVGPWLIGRGADNAPDLQRTAAAAFRVLAIQTGEPGPIAQVLSGIDTALWDLAARREGRPLRGLLGGFAATSVPAYASGINPDGAADTVAAARAAGFRAFKLKTGFADDGANLRAVRAAMHDGERLMVDFNQALDLAAAQMRLVSLTDYGLEWIEEPVAADCPLDDLVRLAAIAPAPLAGGENVTRLGDFEALVDRRAVGVVQPDVAKWGGISMATAIARHAAEHGARFCPHFLGSGVGLWASAQLLAAFPGGSLEVDINPNPLRDLLMPAPRPDVDGRIALAGGPGLGAEPALAECRRWLAQSVTIGGARTGAAG